MPMERSGKSMVLVGRVLFPVWPPSRLWRYRTAVGLNPASRWLRNAATSVLKSR
jgi:hypothetical protein